LKHSIVFGDSWIEAELPDATKTAPEGIFLPLEPVQDIEQAIFSALDHPLDTPSLENVARKAKRVLIAFDDPTVPCYAPMWAFGLNAIIDRLVRAGVAEGAIELLCANSLHRQFTDEELRRLIGKDLVKRFSGRIGCHDAEDPDGMTHLGTTPNGHVVDLNNKVVESDLVIYLNCSTTRGFSGGWKSICVGLSSYRSIRSHHTPDIMSMSLDRNRMHAILDEMGALTEKQLGRDRFFKVETVLSNPLQVGLVFGGSVGATRKAAVELNRANMTNRRDLLEEKTDIVVYGVPDWSPYAAFSYTNPLLTLISTGLGYLGGMIEALGKPGCTVVLATPCPDRWDHDRHPSYKEVWDRVLPETKDPDHARRAYEEEFATRSDYIDRYRNGYGFHGVHGIMALYPLKRLRHASRVIVAGAEDPRVPAHAGFDTASSVEDAVSDALLEHGPGASVALVEYPAAVSRS